MTGAALCVLGLGGAVFALIEQPRLGWSSPAVAGSLIGGLVLFATFLVYESRASDPMLRLSLFRSRNFSVGNIETLAIYGGFSVLFFFLVLYLQQVAGYTPLQSGLALLPDSIVMFLLSSRFGALADRIGPRIFMGIGPVLAGGGMLLLLRVGVHVDYLTQVLPAVLLFSLGLSMTVAPLTATILAGVEQSDAGIASGVNNAVARVAGLVATVSVGALVAAQFSSSLDSHLSGTPLTAPGQAAVAQAKRDTLGHPSVAGVPPGEAVRITVASNRSSQSAFRLGIGVSGVLVIAGGLIGAAGIRNPRRVVAAEHCAGGQLAGAPLDAAGVHAPARAHAPRRPPELLWSRCRGAGQLTSSRTRRSPSGSGSSSARPAAIVVDDRMRTSVPGVWAAGDVIEVPHGLSMLPIRGLTGSHAYAQGRTAGVNAAGERPRLRPGVGPVGDGRGDYTIGGFSIGETLADGDGRPVCRRQGRRRRRAPATSRARRAPTSSCSPSPARCG